MFIHDNYDRIQKKVRSWKISDEPDPKDPKENSVVGPAVDPPVDPAVDVEESMDVSLGDESVAHDSDFETQA